VEQAERDLIASGDVDLHLSALERIDGSGAVLLARLMTGSRHAGSARVSSRIRTTTPSA
jgi:ABC-type transporter Mla MlaB component